MSELDERIRWLEHEVAPILARIARLKRRKAAKIAGKASGPARVKADAVAVKARHHELGGGRGAIALLANEFGCSTRTIHRMLGARHER